MFLLFLKIQYLAQPWRGAGDMTLAAPHQLGNNNSGMRLNNAKNSQMLLLRSSGRSTLKHQQQPSTASGTVMNSSTGHAELEVSNQIT